MRKTLTIIVFFAHLISNAQTNFPQNYFASPIESTIYLAGNFGELRPNHFHMGLDFKTEGKEGMPIKAAADGYVSRVKISSFGYGKVVYITHPNGYVTVYAHLSQLNDTIGAYMKAYQYEQQKFEIDVTFNPNKINIKKGELVGLSGNTGLSGGPHLHFEIREEKTERAVNPLLFGFDVPDNIKPEIKKIRIYPADIYARINGKNSSITLPVKLTKSGYVIEKKDSIKISGNVFIGLETFDKENRLSGKNGTYQISLSIDDKQVYAHQLKSIGFNETRCINTFVDYPERIKSGNFYQRCFVERNNKLGVYNNILNKGIITIEDKAIHKIKINVSDIKNNTSSIVFNLIGDTKAKVIEPVTNNGVAAVFHATEENEFKTNDFFATLPANVLYDDIQFKYDTIVDKRLYSAIHSIHTVDVPLHDNITIGIKPTITLADSMKKYLIITQIPGKQFAGNEWQGDFITAKTKYFGKYAVLLDTVKPTIKAVTFAKTKQLTSNSEIQFTIKDNLSGIQSFDAYIDNRWILMEYEHKQNKIYYKVEMKGDYTPFKKGQNHTFKLVVTDKAGNSAEYTTVFKL